MERGGRTVRLVASDLDGTHLRDDGTLLGGTLRALASLQACGSPLEVVTTRPPHTVRILAPRRAIGLALGGNGAIVTQTTLPPALARELIAELRAAVRG